MCKPASMWVLKGHKAYWSEKTDSHEDIKEEFGFRDIGPDGFVSAVPVEITPPDGNLSLPLEDWGYRVDYSGYPRELPDWYDPEKAEKACRRALKDWAEVKLTGWRLKEAFNPINPFKVKGKELPEEELRELLKNWALVRDSVWASVGYSVWASVWDSVGDSIWGSVGYSLWASVGNSVGYSLWASARDSVGGSIWGSVGNSVWDSLYGYIGSLFPNIKDWKYTDKKNPWAAIRKLWVHGYVPSFDGETWKLHSGEKAEVVLEIKEK